MLVEEEEVCVVARALGAARSARRVCAVVRAAHVLEARDLEARVLAREKAAPKALHLGDERRAVGERAAGHGIGPARLGAGDRDDLEQAVGVVGRLAERAERDAGDADLTQPPEHRADVVRRRARAVRVDLPRVSLILGDDAPCARVDSRAARGGGAVGVWVRRRADVYDLDVVVHLYADRGAHAQVGGDAALPRRAVVGAVAREAGFRLIPLDSG